MLAPRAILIVALLVSFGCSSKKKSDGDSNKPDPAAEKDAASGKPAPDARAIAGDTDADFAEPTGDPFATIGVQPCDDYIERQKSCVESHAPDLIKDQQLDGLAHIATRWRRAAAAGATEHLQKSCEALLSASADATAAWTCKW